MRTQPKIDPEIRDLFDPLTKEEYERLEAKLQIEGCLKPLIVWKETGILLDGHNSLSIYNAHDLPFATHGLSFPDRAAAIQWAIDNQLGRRNLSPEKRAYYIGKEYLKTKQQEPFKPAENIKIPTKSSVAQNEQPGASTAEILAEKHGVSPATVRRDADFAEAVDALPAKAKEKVLSGKAGQSKSEIATGILCDRCRRVGPVEDCPKCAELRKPRRESNAKSKPKAEQQPKGQGAAAPAPIKGVCPTCGRAWKGNSFIKPTLEQITAYCAERKNKIDPQAFIDYYDSVGWKIGGKTQMRDFKAAVRNWERMAKQRSNKGKLFAGPKAFAEGK